MFSAPTLNIESSFESIAALSSTADRTFASNASFSDASGKVASSETAKAIPVDSITT